MVDSKERIVDDILSVETMVHHHCYQRCRADCNGDRSEAPFLKLRQNWQLEEYIKAGHPEASSFNIPMMLPAGWQIDVHRSGFCMVAPWGNESWMVVFCVTLNSRPKRCKCTLKFVCDAEWQLTDRSWSVADEDSTLLTFLVSGLTMRKQIRQVSENVVLHPM